MRLLDGVEQALSSCVNYEVNDFEAVVEVGIGHFAQGRPLDKAQERRDFRHSFAHLSHRPQVLIVHRDDVVEGVEVTREYSPRLARAFGAVLCKNVLGAGMGRGTHLPIRRARRIRFDSPIQSFGAHQMHEDSFGHRGAAHVGQTDK